ncbi:MAG: reverse transcriptase-like protein [Candidatus Saccharibacteria bacterium]|nr:reverse transcriptase-like protein [Candidatus Saccharibacteria bacterium]
MKQRIRVVGIIRKGEEILMLKRNLGRMESGPIWELPTGKIQFGEQPEEAMTRVVYEYLGVKVVNLKLLDVITFVALSGVNRLSNLYIVFELSVAEEEKLMPTERYTAYRYLKYGERAGMRLDEATLAVLEIELPRREPAQVRGAANGATVYVDGGSRGNPGPAGVGYYIVGEQGELLKKGGEFIGFATSRVAEYYALKEGCEQALELGLKTVRFVGDSLMMINQMNGIYKVKNKDLLPIYEDIQEIIKKFEAVAFVHVSREQNYQADMEVNLAIDRHFGIEDGGGHLEG